jgi:adenine-specific DNA-methyltransferase
LLTKVKFDVKQKLSDVLIINQGLVSGADRFSKRLFSKLPHLEAIEAPIFVFNESELPLNFPASIFKRFIKNGQIKPFKIFGEIDKYVLYSVGDKIEAYPEWIDHLRPYKSHLEKRREVMKGSKSWYELQWGRRETLFKGYNIVSPQRSLVNSFALCKEEYFGSADIYFLSDANNDLVKLKAYTVYLNSAWVYLWLYHMGKRKGELLELYKTPLGRIPVPEFSENDLIELSRIHDAYCLTEDESLLTDAENLIGAILGFTHNQVKSMIRFKRD